MIAHAEDLALAQAVVRGEVGALERFCELYQSRLYRFIYNQVSRSREDAEDVLQEALIAALNSLHSYRGDSPLYHWLCGVAWNKAADWRRRQFRRIRIEERAQACMGAERVPGPEHRLEVRDALARLPGRWQRALIRRYVDGLSEAELAQEMGATIKCAESVLHRAKCGLRAALAEGA